MRMVKLGNDWDGILSDEWEKPYYRQLHSFLKEEYSKTRIYPDMYDIFNALKYTSFADTRAVIIGQDPYHGPGQAHGLCFSVKKGVPLPPSLVNIYKEITDDLGVTMPQHGELTGWAKQGVLLLNTVLTVRAGQPNKAVTRKGMRGYCLGTDECITINEAIRMMTVNGAILNGEQDEKGTLEAGKLADLVVLSADLTTIDPENLKHLQAELTMLDGKIIFERNE